MRFGVTLPNLGIPGGPGALADLGQEAEEAGWHGVFVWDCVWSPDWDAHFREDAERAATWDPWVVLAVLASRTTRVRLGTMVTPPARRRPWKLAHETTTLDRLSGGRMVLPVSLGWGPDGAFAKVSEERDRRRRAERLDEALDVLAGLWSGRPVTFRGRHYDVEDLTLPAAVQQPRVPVWVVGAWPRPRSMARAVRWDGVIPATLSAHGSEWGAPSAEEVASVAAYVGERRVPSHSYDIVVEGNTSRDPEKARAKVEPFLEAGATWWLEGVWTFLYDAPSSVDRMRSRIRAGPPAVTG
jgi:alkanesulfonate monooxygenase SsuD/methylene tetrahydromethanopterin reductase-like flavin-dependent oxidoreductase (luciferase family)